jgi:hypothetical protein
LDRLIPRRCASRKFTESGSKLRKEVSDVVAFESGRDLKNENVWFRDLDSNQDTQLQRLMSYRLDDPGNALGIVAEPRKPAQALPASSFPRLFFSCILQIADDNVCQQSQRLLRAS